jgi:DNA-binding MarR family transcriptional regulator
LEIYQQTDCGQELGRILTEQLFLYLSHRENAFMLKSPTQRYLDLFEEQPRLIQEIPQKYLASYIGITPQALSRIRAKLGQRD